jgi:type IV fimbrial biogenesis protein FimT
MTNSRTCRSGVDGFTLTELMIALTIGAMLLTLGTPSFTAFLRNSEVRSNAEAVSNGLRLARAEATRLNQPVAFRLAGVGDPSWTINVFDPATGTFAQPPLQTYFSVETGKSAKVSVTPANATGVIFNGLGRVISPSPTATPNLQQIDVGSIVVGEARALRVYVDDIHEIRICDPDPLIKALVPADARAC